jgi:hypothetical protein
MLEKRKGLIRLPSEEQAMASLLRNKREKEDLRWSTSNPSVEKKRQRQQKGREGCHNAQTKGAFYTNQPRVLGL